MKWNSFNIVGLILISLLCACSNHAQKSGNSNSSPTRSVTRAPTHAIVPAIQLEKPAAIVEALNRLYNESNNTCREADSNQARGHYYCSGIMLRQLSFEADNPWMHTPTDNARGSTSWEWLRHELTDYKPNQQAGFILRNPADAKIKNLPVLDTGFICIFPYSADTTHGRGHQGCGQATEGRTPSPKRMVSTSTALKRGNESFAWGSCDQLGITTAAQWNALWIVGEQVPHAQCSWNVDSQSGWNALLESRLSFPALNMWNTELLLSNEDDGSRMPQYISAVFYNAGRDCGAGLVVAQSMQKQLNEAGFSVPILSADFTPGVLNMFSYLETDQAVAQ